MAFPVPFHIQFGVGVDKLADQIGEFLSVMSAKVLILTGTTVSLSFPSVRRRSRFAPEVWTKFTRSKELFAS